MAVIKVDAEGNASSEDNLTIDLLLAINNYSPVMLIAKSIKSIFNQEPLNDKVTENIERIIKSGKDNGVDCLEIQCEKRIGLTAKMKQYGATIAAGSSGNTVIKVRYK